MFLYLCQRRCAGGRPQAAPKQEYNEEISPKFFLSLAAQPLISIKLSLLLKTRFFKSGIQTATLTFPSVREKKFLKLID